MILRLPESQPLKHEWPHGVKILDLKSGWTDDLLAGFADQLLSDWASLWDTDSEDAHDLDVIA